MELVASTFRNGPGFLQLLMGLDNRPRVHSHIMIDHDDVVSVFSGTRETFGECHQHVSDIAKLRGRS